MTDTTDKTAQKILRANDRGGYTVPTPGLYPYQWNWDSAFAALGFATFDLNRAWQEVETLFQGQWTDGFLPHIVFRVDEPSYFPGPSIWRTGVTPPTSGITQPPVVATVVRALFEQDNNRDRLEALYPKILAWHRWFATYRDPLNNGLVMTSHPWETGRDNSPEWDVPARGVDSSKVEPYERRDLGHVDSDMRPKKDDYDRYIAILEFGRSVGWNHKTIAEKGPFRVLDVGLSFILLRANRDLLALAEALSRSDDVDFLRDRIELAEYGVSYLWDEAIGAFCSRDLIADKSSGMCTSTSFLALYADVGSVDQRARLFENFKRIATTTRYMLPSTDPHHSAFDSKRYWRGPVWAVVNLMAAIGFYEQGYALEADRIREDTLSLIKKAGFFEAFDPISGEGTGGPDFTWTAAVWLYWSGLGQHFKDDIGEMV